MGRVDLNRYGLFLAVVMVILLLSSDLSATETRVATMGGVGMYTRDNSNIFFFPGTINYYADQAVAELRAKNSDYDYTIGGQVKVDDIHIFGLYLNRPLQLNIPADVAEEVMLDRTIDFFFGVPLKDHKIGLHLALGFDGYNDDGDPDVDTDDIDETASYLGLSAGLSNEKIDVGIFFELPNVDSDIGDDKNEFSGTTFGVNFRGFLGDEVEFVPLGTLSFTSSSRDFTSGTDADLNTSRDIDRLTLGLGIGFNYEINRRNLIVLGIEALGMSKIDEKIVDVGDFTYTELTYPGIYFGVETQISKWLIGRFGAAQIYQLSKDKADLDNGEKTESSSRSSSFNATFGLAFKLSDLQLDIVFNEGLIFDGPEFISGSNETLADKISLTYKF